MAKSKFAISSCDITMLTSIFLLFGHVSVVIAGSFPHVKIWQDLLKDYDRRVNPVRDPHSPVNLGVGLAIENIIDLDFKSQVLSLKVWVYLQWKDEFLVYDENKYNTGQLFAHPGEIWVPQLLFMNSLTEEYQLFQKSGTKVFVSPDGSALWIPQVFVKIYCPVKVNDFPFDEQPCSVKLMSWDQPTSMLNISAAGSYLDVRNLCSDQWILKATPCFATSRKYGTGRYGLFKCPITLVRQPLYYVFNLVVPCLVLVIVGSLTFVLPVDSGEKISLSVTILLAMTVMLQFIMDNVPSVSSGVPFLGQFIMACILLLALATAMSVTVVKVLAKSHREKKTVSPEQTEESDNKAKWWRVAVWLDRVFLMFYIFVMAILVFWVVAMVIRHKHLVSESADSQSGC